MITTYAQALGVSIEAVANAIDGLKKQNAIFEKRKCITLNFPFSCFKIEENEELQKELKKDEFIDTADGIFYIPQPFAELYE
jgi:hypothetical protein